MNDALRVSGLLVLRRRWSYQYLSPTLSRAIVTLTGAHFRGALLLWLCLLLTPDFPLHSTFGLVVQWSDGLTLSNLLIPVLTFSVLAWAWLSGHRLLPPQWPLGILLFVCLLGWGAATWVPWLLSGALQGAGLISIVAHWGKLLLIVILAAHVTMLAARARHRILTVFLVCMGINALIGLVQALGWFSVFSPLAKLDQHVRVTGTFYDANMYGALVALALVLCIACATEPELRPSLRIGCAVVAAALALNLVLAASRAGYLALLTELLVLCMLRRWKLVRWIVLGVLALGLLFPGRTVGRLQTIFHSGLSIVALDAAVLARKQSMRDSFYQYLQHPWLGLGFGRALYLGVPSRAGFDYAGTIPLAPRNDRSFTGAQNMFLTVLCETGPIGLLLYLAWLFAMLRPFLRSASHRHSQRPASQFDAVMVRAMLAGLIGLIAASCTVELFLNARMLGIVLILAASQEAFQAAHHAPFHHNPV